MTNAACVDLERDIRGTVLKGKKDLVPGIANAHSVAYGCARVFRWLGAELAVTRLDGKALPPAEPWARELGASILVPGDVSREAETDAVFEQIGAEWGCLDVALHAIAFAPKAGLQERLADSSSAEFKTAMDVSRHSFTCMARLAEPLMGRGGTLLVMSDHRADKMVPSYNLIGPVKTRAASWLKDFDVPLSEGINRSPIGALVDIHDVGRTTAFLAPLFARPLRGMAVYVDGDRSVMARGRGMPQRRARAERGSRSGLERFPLALARGKRSGLLI